MQPLDPNNLIGKKLSEFSEATSLTNVFIAAFIPNSDNLYISALYFAPKDSVYTKTEVVALLQQLQNTLTAQINAKKESYTKIISPSAFTNILQDDDLKGAEILLLTLDKGEIDIELGEASFDPISGEINLTPSGGIYSSSHLKVIYKK